MLSWIAAGVALAAPCPEDHEIGSRALGWVLAGKRSSAVAAVASLAERAVGEGDGFLRPQHAQNHWPCAALAASFNAELSPLAEVDLLDPDRLLRVPEISKYLFTRLVYRNK